jgi:isoamylase
MKPRKVWLGTPYPLGATWTGEGVNFALFSENAEAVDLCLFASPESGEETARIRMAEHTDMVWHAFLPDLQPGQLYGYRVHGRFAPKEGFRFNPNKLLLDPYARALSGPVKVTAEMFDYQRGKPEAVRLDTANDALMKPKCVVVDTAFEWGTDVRPETPLHSSIIYEAHVAGFTKLCPDLAPNLRGTFAGFGSKPAIDHLTRLGVTAVQLLPVHQHVDPFEVLARGLTNYWGYDAIGYFAPHAEYSSSGVLGQQVSEFKAMVKNLHAAGIEVILDVGYDHTGEGNHLGPLLSFRGIDNRAYYRLTEDDPMRYQDATGMGNAFDIVQPRVLQVVMDSLRYWVTEMHVDGFRFDQAAALSRQMHEVDRLGVFFDTIHQDPVLSTVKLIAEPLAEIGPEKSGNFPVLWAEDNLRYKRTVRSYWRGDGAALGELAFRISGSSDLYQMNGKRPYASINFVTSHDGFTLTDLVSYREKHNEKNGDPAGEEDNLSENYGVEGPTSDERINEVRRRQRRNFLSTLLLSQGVPMLCGGDEYGRTQQGNNNAYCQDNELSWFAWERDEPANRDVDFTARLIRLRKDHPIFRRPKFFQGRKIRGADVKDIMWLHPGGHEMTDEEWEAADVHTLGVLLSGDTMDVRDEQGVPITDDSFLLLFHAGAEPAGFTLPGEAEVQWEAVIDTADATGFVARGRLSSGGAQITMAERSFQLLRLVQPKAAQARKTAH